MKRTPELFEQIESYLSGTLTQEEAALFEKELQENTKLLREVALHRQMLKELENTDTLAFRKKVARISNAGKDKPANSLSGLFKAAAAVIVVAGLSFLLFQLSRTSNTSFFEDYYVQYPVEDALRGGTVETKKMAALNRYKSKDFAQAIPELEAILKEFPEDVSLKMYLGNAYLNSTQTVKAVGIFTSIGKDNNHYDHAQWYLALTYVKLEDFEKAKGVLEEVKLQQGVHAKDAERLLNELNAVSPDDP